MSYEVVAILGAVFRFKHWGETKERGGARAVLDVVCFNSQLL